ncbi:hypothetical protein DNTS_013461, partial [Danionella cerebrum]
NTHDLLDKVTLVETMKLSVIAVLVVALAIGSESASLVKRDASAELDKIAKYFQDFVDNLKNVEGPELVSKANTYLEQSRAQFQPMVEKLHEQLKPLSGNIEEQIKPLAASVQAQVAPLAGIVQTQVEDMIGLLIDNAKAILRPQSSGHKEILAETMKLSVIAVLVVALAIGSESASLVKRDASAELDKIAKYFQDFVDNLKNVEGPELVSKANTYLEQSRAQFQPMVEKLHEQLKPLSSNIEEQIKPLAASVQAQVAPLAGIVQTHVEDVLKFVSDKSKTILPPQ